MKYKQFALFVPWHSERLMPCWFNAHHLWVLSVHRNPNPVTTSLALGVIDWAIPGALLHNGSCNNCGIDILIQISCLTN